MVHCDSTIDLLIPVLRTEKTLPSLKFVKTILKAFINGIALEKRSEYHVFDPTTIKTFLGVYEATGNFISDIAKISEQAPLSSAHVSAALSIPVVAPVPSRIGPTFSAVPAPKAATEKKSLDNVTCFNCDERGHKLYSCGISCQLEGCLRNLALEIYGRSSIPEHSAKCCSLVRQCPKRFKALIRSKLVCRPAVLKSNKLPATPLALSCAQIKKNIWPPRSLLIPPRILQQ
jgi:hypothetical protein